MSELNTTVTMIVRGEVRVSIRKSLVEGCVTVDCSDSKFNFAYLLLDEEAWNSIGQVLSRPFPGGKEEAQLVASQGGK